MAAFPEAMQRNQRLRKFLRDFRGMCKEEATAVDMQTSEIRSLSIDDAHSQHELIADRCKLRIPYAGTQLCCDALFESVDTFDIVFDAQFADFAPRYDEVPSFFTTDTHPQRFANAIREVCAAFKRYSMRRLKALADGGSQCAGKIHTQIEELCSVLKDGLESEQLEVAIGRSTNGDLCVYVQVRVIFLEHVVEQATSSGSATSLSSSGPNSSSNSDLMPILRFELRVTLQSDTASRRNVSVYAEKALEMALGGAPLAKAVGAFQFPVDTFADTIRHFVANVSSRVDATRATAIRKREFVAALLDRFGAAVVEYDAETYRFVSFLMAIDGDSFSILVTVRIHKEFPHPKEPPVLILMSACQTNVPVPSIQTPANVTQSQLGGATSTNGGAVNGTPLTKEIREYPYSPRWSAAELTDRIRTFLSEAVPEFSFQVTKYATLQ